MVEVPWRAFRPYNDVDIAIRAQFALAVLLQEHPCPEKTA
jgi:hypothetical protein